MEKKFIKYRSKEIVEACEFVPGMEDGFVKRFYNKEDVAEDGTIYTSGLIGDLSIDVPYILDTDGERKILLGEGYMIVKDEDGELGSMLKSEFDILYERKNKNL